MGTPPLPTPCSPPPGQGNFSTKLVHIDFAHGIAKKRCFSYFILKSCRGGAKQGGVKNCMKFTFAHGLEEYCLFRKSFSNPLPKVHHPGHRFRRKMSKVAYFPRPDAKMTRVKFRDNPSDGHPHHRFQEKQNSYMNMVIFPET